MRIITRDYGVACGEIANRQQSVALTVLHRPIVQEDEWTPAKGGWTPLEFAFLKDQLTTTVFGNPHYPEYVVVRGHYSKAELPAVLNRAPYSTWTVSDLRDRDLPFVPRMV